MLDAFGDKKINNRLSNLVISLSREAIKEIQLMPYHSVGIEKSYALGKGQQERFETPSQEELIRLREDIKRQSGKRYFFKIW